VVYPLDEVLLLTLLATLAGAETFTDIARFGEKKPALLRRFRPVQGWHAIARPDGRHLRNAQCRSVPGMFRPLGRASDGHPRRGHCDER
jgi:hypothetical protein